MQLNLENKLKKEEQNEIKRRAYSMMEQLFLEGISVGRELSREDLEYETEKYIKDKIIFLSNYFMNDQVWIEQPPANYRETKEIPTHQPKDTSFGGHIDDLEKHRNVNVDIED